MARRRRRNPWTSTGEVLVWILFALLLFPAGFAGWAVGHYTSLGKPPSTVTRTVTAASSTPAPPTTTSTTAPSTTTSSGSSGGNAAAGKAVFASSGCAACHTFSAVGATGTIGPNLDTAPTIDAKADHNMALAAFVKQSIVDPKAYLAKGYSTSVMPTYFGTKLSAKQLADLVALIVSNQK